ncbi:GrpB family protein [Jatrophihabitans fulvus]
MPTAAEITTHHDPDPDEDPWVHGPPAPVVVRLVPYDPAWPQRFASLAEGIRAALGDTARHVEHVGSTSVPGLAAKDVIDIDLEVPDPRDEDAYVPALEAAGWRLVVREPSWHQHRCLNRREPGANLHVFGPDCPETVRHRMFRDWLREHDDDRARYEQAKRDAIPGGGAVMDYNARKQDVIREIYDRLFRAHGLLPGG